MPKVDQVPSDPINLHSLPEQHPRVIVVVDHDWTIGQPGLKQKLLEHLGVDYRAFSRAHKKYWTALPASARRVDPRDASLAQRLDQTRFLVEQMQAGLLLGTNGQLGASFDVAQLRAFSGEVDFFPGARETLRDLPTQHPQVALRRVIVTHSYEAPLLDFIAAGMVDDVYGQRFKDKPGQPNRIALDGMLTVTAKADAIKDLMKRENGPDTGLLAITDGYGDRHLLEAVKNAGGQTLGVLNVDSENALQDQLNLLSYIDEGILDDIVPNDWTERGLVAGWINTRIEQILERTAEVATPTRSSVTTSPFMAEDVIDLTTFDQRAPSRRSLSGPSLG